MPDSPKWRYQRDQTLSAVMRLEKEKGYPPTLVEIGEELGVGESTIRQRLLRARLDGYVVWERYKSRTIRVTSSYKLYRAKRDAEGKA